MIFHDSFLGMKFDHLAFGIDIGGTNTKIGLFDQSGTLINFKTLPTNKDIKAEDFIQDLAKFCETEILQQYKIKLGDSKILGVGAGAPMANYFTGLVDHAPNLGWNKVELKRLLNFFFKCRAVIENDANLAAVGEKKWGAGKELSDFILVTLGTGVGTGLILSHKLYRGYMALGAEGGHVLIPHSKTRPCSCGGVNHLESFLSAKGIKQTIKEITGEEWSLEKLSELFHHNDPVALNIVDQISLELAHGLVSMAVLLGPQAFILGGGVSQLGGSFNHLVETKINKLIHFSLVGKIKVFSGTLTSDKGAVYGGAAQLFDEVRI